MQLVFLTFHTKPYNILKPWDTCTSSSPTYFLSLPYKHSLQLSAREWGCVHAEAEKLRPSVQYTCVTIAGCARQLFPQFLPVFSTAYNSWAGCLFAKHSTHFCFLCNGLFGPFASFGLTPEILLEFYIILMLRRHTHMHAWTHAHTTLHKYHPTELFPQFLFQPVN